MRISEIFRGVFNTCIINFAGRINDNEVQMRGAGGAQRLVFVEEHKQTGARSQPGTHARQKPTNA
jgi:hypothetical protein